MAERLLNRPPHAKILIHLRTGALQNIARITSFAKSKGHQKNQQRDASYRKHDLSPSAAIFGDKQSNRHADSKLTETRCCCSEPHCPSSLVRWQQFAKTDRNQGKASRSNARPCDKTHERMDKPHACGKRHADGTRSV